MMHDLDDSALRARFAELHATRDGATPPLDRVLAAAETRRRTARSAARRRLLYACAAAVTVSGAFAAYALDRAATREQARLLADALAAQIAGIEPLYLILAGAAVILLVASMASRVKQGRAQGSAAGTLAPAEATGEPFSGVLLASRPEHDMRGAARTTVWSVVIHAWLIAGLVWATMSLGTEAQEEPEVVPIVDAQDEPPPPPPPPPPPQEIQETPPVEVAKGFQTLSVPDIVPPEIPPPQIGVRINEADFSGVGAEGGRADGKEGAPPQSDLLVAPTFTPYTVAPELKNTAEVQRVLERTYPPLLRDAGIGGTVLLWFLIDENGKVVKTQLKESSGHAPLDEAATRVASVMQFSPAINRDRKVPVWVAIPILFTTK